MKKILQLTLLFLFIGNIGFTQTLLLQESFEGDASNYDANTFNMSPLADYFTAFNTSTPPDGWPRAFSNVDGSSMFGAEDLDDVNNPLAPGDINGYIVISSQNVSSYDQVQITIALSAVYDGGNDISFEQSDPDGIFIQYAFDGNIATPGDANVNTGTYTTIGQFKGNNGTSASGLYEDTNLDGNGNGTLLTEAFQDFTYTFNTNGATNVSIRIKLDNDLSEEIGVDNIRVYGIAAATAPTVTTTAASSISTTSATLGGNVTSDGGATVTERGIVYSTTDATPTIAEGATKDANGSGTGTFSESIGSLSVNTTYYYNAYAINTEGTSYGTASQFTTLKLSQTITFGALPTKTYGDADFAPGATASSGLTVTYSSSNTSVATIVSGKIHIVGAGSCTIYADQAGNSTYYAASQESQSLTVNKATPTVTVWPTAAGITYGQDLSSATLSGGTASVAGSFAYDDNTITPNAGTYSAALTFTPTDASNYNTVAGNINVAVAKVTPTVTAWPTAAGITYGQDLSSATLSGGTASVAGSFAYNDNTITPNAGTYSAALTFTPTDASNYNTVAGNINVAVAKATPTVTVWPTAAGITYGQDLSAATLSGGTASVAGSFAYNDNTITPNAGTYSAALTFTPTDATNYNTVAGNINVAVAKATPTVTAWPTAAGITYGQDLSAATLSGGTASVAGSFAYDDNTITPNAGTYSADVTFTPTDASNYNTVAGNINVAVAKVTPTVTAWPTAAGITYGQDLSSATLSGGTASVAGSFNYDDNTITPNAGTYSADVTFTPADATNYNTVAGNINVAIAKVTPTVTAWPTAAGITYGQDLSSATLSGGTASVAGNFDYDDNTITPNAGTYSADVTFTPTDATNYNTVAGNINVAVAKATPTVTAWPTAAGITYGQDLSAATLSGGTASVAGSFAYDDNTITPNAGTYSADVTFTPTDATNYNTVAGNINVAVAKVTPTVTAWPTAAGITYGQDLSSATLSGGTASTAGSFDYDDNTITPNAGTYNADVTFTPTDATNYNTVAGNINVTVAKVTPTVTAWPTAAGITYGQDLSSATLSGGTASTAGNFDYDDNTITPNAGTYNADVTFTPTDATNYNTVAGNINVTVAKATPTVTAWPTAARITYGQDLSAATLTGGTASVAGSFDYDDNTITPDVGIYSAALTFTPTDGSNYNTVAGNIDINVYDQPSVTTNGATAIAAKTVSLNGMVNANNSSTVVTFEYGLTDSYGTSIAAAQSPVSGITDTNVNVDISGLTPNTTYHYRVVGINDAGTNNGSDLTFTTLSQDPIVSTTAATSVESSGATLNGTVNANDLSTTVTFEYGLTDSYGTTVTADQSPVNGITSTNVSKAITDLTPNTTYHYRVVGVNSEGTANGTDLTFTTSSQNPTVTTAAATEVDVTTATLNGTVNANDFSTSVTFEYGLTSAYGNTITAGQSPVTGSTDAEVSADVTGLKPNTTYHFRVKGESDGGSATGNDLSFTTDKYSQTITFDALTDKTTNDADFAPGATSDLGLDISYSSNNEQVATIVDNKIHIIGAGTTEITASQNGNDTVYAATPVHQNLTVTEATGIDDLKSMGIKFYPNPTADILTIETEENYFSDKIEVSIIDLKGSVIYSNTLTKSLWKINVAEYPQGLYIIQIKNQKEVRKHKLLIE